jgi:hypothetical protein
MQSASLGTGDSGIHSVASIQWHTAEGQFEDQGGQGHHGREDSDQESFVKPSTAAQEDGLLAAGSTGPAEHACEL